MSILENIAWQLDLQTTKAFGIKVKDTTAKIVYKVTNFLKATQTSHAPFQLMKTFSPNEEGYSW